MEAKSIIIAHSSGCKTTEVSRKVEPIDGLSIVAKTHNLVETFAEVEDRVPDAVLISNDLANLPEFEVMRALFSTLGVRWMVLCTPNGKSHSPPYRADLFSIPEDANTSYFESQLNTLTRKSGQAARSSNSRKMENATGPYDRFILIGASTGGVDALLSVLKAFPSDCPPTLIVQHTGAGFGQSLVSLLDKQCSAAVRLAETTRVLKRGNIVVAAGIEGHLTITPDRPIQMNIEKSAPVSGHRPSVDVMFSSAVPVASHCVAALLTGMGRDGANGLLDLRRSGARTFAQDEKTSVVFGMPRAAIEIGAAEKVLGLDEIGAALLQAARKSTTSTRIGA